MFHHQFRNCSPTGGCCGASVSPVSPFGESGQGVVHWSSRSKTGFALAFCVDTTIRHPERVRIPTLQGVGVRQSRVGCFGWSSVAPWGWAIKLPTQVLSSAGGDLLFSLFRASCRRTLLSTALGTVGSNSISRYSSADPKTCLRAWVSARIPGSVEMKPMYSAGLLRDFTMSIQRRKTSTQAWRRRSGSG